MKSIISFKKVKWMIILILILHNNSKIKKLNRNSKINKYNNSKHLNKVYFLENKKQIIFKMVWNNQHNLPYQEYIMIINLIRIFLLLVLSIVF